MKVFWLRISLFSLLWVFGILTTSTFQPLSILFFALALGLYFLLSIPYAQLWKYIGLLLIVGAHGIYLAEEGLPIVVLSLYLLVDACFRLKRSAFIVFLSISIVSLLFIGFYQERLFVEQIAVYFLFGFLVLFTNRQKEVRSEQQILYEQLVDEYRSLKRMHVSAENAARLEERTRIARDIHDSVGHRLTALIMKLEVLGIQEKSDTYDELKTIARESLDETRLAVKTLQIEDNEGIATVVHLIRKLEAESHLRIQFTLNHGVLSIAVTNEMSVTLYRVVQEALTNIMRHSESREAYITLSESAIGDITFEIANPVRNPKPFVVGFGLKNMRARVKEINGVFRVYQTEDRFVVTGTIPKGEV